MVAAIDVNDVQRMDFVKMMLESPCREYIGDAGVKAGTQQGEKPGVAELLLDRKSTRLNSSHTTVSRMPSSA